MSARAKKPPKALLPIFNNPPLLEGESREEFNQLFNIIVEAIAPADAIAWLYTFDVVILTWEIRRERQVKVTCLEVAKESAKQNVLELQDRLHHLNTGLFADKKVEKLVTAARTNAGASKQLAKQLEEIGYTEDRALASAFVRSMDTLRSLEERIVSLEMRMIGKVRELERYNEAAAARLRRRMTPLLAVVPVEPDQNDDQTNRDQPRKRA
jgi:hypothetical protein